MKNITENFDFWGMPLEEKDQPRPKEPQNIKQKEKFFEADQFLDNLTKRVGGLVMDFNNTKEEIKSLYKEDSHGKSN